MKRTYTIKCVHYMSGKVKYNVYVKDTWFIFGSHCIARHCSSIEEAKSKIDCHWGYTQKKEKVYETVVKEGSVK